MNELAEIMPKNLCFRSAITNAEDYIGTFPQVELEVIHHFAPGMYARELHIPAGIVLTGHIHKTEHLFILLAGEIEQISEHTGLERIKAPFRCISKPGAKRMGVSISDVIVITVHATTETNVDKLEAELVCKTYSEYEQFLLCTTKQIEVNL